MEYRPEVPQAAWGETRAFVEMVVAESRDQLRYSEAAIWHAVAHHVDWAVFVAGLDEDRAQLFSRAVIAAGVQAMETESTASRARRRSILLRVSEALGESVVPVPLPPLAASDPSAPYASRETDALRMWASLQATADKRDSARVLLALGLGAGLPPRDIAHITASSVSADGRFVQVDGERHRIVPVFDDWAHDLRSMSREQPPEQRLFRPTAEPTKNFITTFVHRSQGRGLKPATQRMRASWLVRHLSEGVPMQDLLYWSGVASMDALVRYERYLPRARGAAPSDSAG
ncbi:hypothetical protein [Microbacterium sp. NPDC055683]